MRSIGILLVTALLLSGCLREIGLEKAEPAVLKTISVQLDSVAIVLNVRGSVWSRKLTSSSPYSMVEIGAEIGENTIIAIKPNSELQIETKGGREIEIKGTDNEEWYTFYLAK